jgi:hypothetical protein
MIREDAGRSRTGCAEDLIVAGFRRCSGEEKRRRISEIPLPI